MPVGRGRGRERHVLIVSHTAENGLSFIETSALDASNVESAFQNILSGKCQLQLAQVPRSNERASQKSTTSYRTRRSSRRQMRSARARARLSRSHIPRMTAAPSRAASAALRRSSRAVPACTQTRDLHEYRAASVRLVRCLVTLSVKLGVILPLLLVMKPFSIVFISTFYWIWDRLARSMLQSYNGTADRLERQLGLAE